MLSTIFSVLSVILMLVVLYGVFCLVVGVSVGIIQYILNSPLFYLGLIGGLIAYWCGAGEAGIKTGMILGVVIPLVFWGVVALFKGLQIPWGKVLSPILWGIVGVIIGAFMGMSILFGLIGFIYGLYRIL